MHGREPWRSDGVNTTLVRDIVSGGLDASAEQLVGTAGGQTVFFLANDRVHGQEIWKTDGTPEGTSLLRDIAVRPEGSGVLLDFAPGSAHSNPRYLTEWRGSLFFVVDTANGPHGTSAGTVRLAGGEWLNGLNGLMELNGELVFREGYNRFWKTDGTPEGTVRFAQLGNGFSYAVHHHGRSALFHEAVQRGGDSSSGRRMGCQGAKKPAHHPPR